MIPDTIFAFLAIYGAILATPFVVVPVYVVLCLPIRLVRSLFRRESKPT